MHHATETAQLTIQAAVFAFTEIGNHCKMLQQVCVSDNIFATDTFMKSNHTCVYIYMEREREREIQQYLILMAKHRRSTNTFDGIRKIVYDSMCNKVLGGSICENWKPTFGRATSFIYSKRKLQSECGKSTWHRRFSKDEKLTVPSIAVVVINVGQCEKKGVTDDNARGAGNFICVEHLHYYERKSFVCRSAIV